MFRMQKLFLLAPASLLLLLAAAPVSVGQTVLLDVGTVNCTYCRQMDPVVERLKAEGAPIEKVDASRDSQIASQLGVRSYPTFVMLVDGKETGRIVGFTSYEKLRGLLATASSPRAPAQEQSTPRNDRVQATFASNSRPAGEQGPPAASLSSGEASLVSASVRIRVDDPEGHAFGTGTIIDARQGEALVLTCGHLFRDKNKQPLGDRAKVTVEIYDASQGTPQVVDRVSAVVVRTNFEKDLALIAIRSARPLVTARMASRGPATSPGEALRSVGCDHGADPSLRTGQVVELARCDGAECVVGTGAPVVGRSGGGLFNRDGELVGVCFGADVDKNEGLYVGVAEVHAELDAQNLSAVYRDSPIRLASNPNPIGVGPGLEPVPGPAAPVVRGQDAGADQGWDNPAPLAPIAPAAAQPAMAQSPMAQLSGLSPREQGALAELARTAADAEVVCVVHPSTPGATTEVFRLRNLSPQFIEALRAMQAHSESGAAQPPQRR
ncbi:Thioredoxin [Pirellulimonas nuda]|uniref:Thioredoxin n=1 Tax=Pirellulimonas nuda TaxID=2528009 RepID=A0A518DJP9_9BACT|nr:trypsin-like peptidase domain-containing protein [Pirellulimonas nuda]QDU91676.1 Thioredoxin [Pirellulimonas nuda]